MALDKIKLINDLKAIKTLDNTSGEDNTDAALEMLAEAIDAFIRSGALQGVTSAGQTISGKVI